MLRRIISRYQNTATRDSASLTEAATTIEQWCIQHRIIGGTLPNILQNLWPKYRSVSHLWAAFFLMEEADLMTKLPITQWFTFFCGTAQWLLEQGTAIKPKHARAGQTILVLDDAWAIPVSSVPRMEDGTIRNRVWNTEPDAHDIRKTGKPLFRERA
jgi:hypothetical protein